MEANAGSDGTLIMAKNHSNEAMKRLTLHRIASSLLLPSFGLTLGQTLSPRLGFWIIFSQVGIGNFNPHFCSIADIGTNQLRKCRLKNVVVTQLWTLKIGLPHFCHSHPDPLGSKIICLSRAVS
jgi:hypothetical protein